MTVEAENIFKEAFNMNTVQGEIPTDAQNITLSNTDDLTLQTPGANKNPHNKFISDVKKDAKVKILLQENNKIYEHTKNLIKQGKFLELTHIENTDATWKSFLFNLPRGTMKFVLNSSIDTLPTRVNLKLWGKLVNGRCF